MEVGGTVKNIIAIGCGISDGLGFGANARAALITRGLVEITRLGLTLGARAETFQGLSGLGDLVLTCTDDQSRNRRMGLALAAGQDRKTIEQSIGQVVEGVYAAEAVHIWPGGSAWTCLSPNRSIASFTRVYHPRRGGSADDAWS